MRNKKWKISVNDDFSFGGNHTRIYVDEQNEICNMWFASVDDTASSGGNKLWMEARRCF